MKRTLLLITTIFATIGMAANALAQEFAPTQDEESHHTDADIGYMPSRLSAHASLLYLKPGAGNLEYGVLVNPLPAPSPHWQFQDVDPQYGPAFDVGLQLLVGDTGNDVCVNWTHLNTTDEHSFFGDPTQFVGPIYEIGPDASAFKLGRGRVHFEYDAVNLDAGVHLTSGGPAEVRLFGGLQYACISQNLASNFQSYDGLSANGNTIDSLFNGVGPRAGMQAQFFHGDFDFLGQFAGAALIGTMQSRLDFTAISPNQGGNNVVAPNPQSLTSPNMTQIVPAMETRIGGGYSFGGRDCGRFRIEAGYQAAVYFNAINHYNVSDVVVPSNVQGVGVFLRTAEHLQSNFTAHGPYLSATWTF